MPAFLYDDESRHHPPRALTIRCTPSSTNPGRARQLLGCSSTERRSNFVQHRHAVGLRRNRAVGVADHRRYCSRKKVSQQNEPPLFFAFNFPSKLSFQNDSTRSCPPVQLHITAGRSQVPSFLLQHADVEASRRTTRSTPTTTVRSRSSISSPSLQRYQERRTTGTAGEPSATPAARAPSALGQEDMTQRHDLPDQLMYLLRQAVRRPKPTDGSRAIWRVPAMTG